MFSKRPGLRTLVFGEGVATPSVLRAAVSALASHYDVDMTSVDCAAALETSLQAGDWDLLLCEAEPSNISIPDVRHCLDTTKNDVSVIALSNANASAEHLPSANSFSMISLPTDSEKLLRLAKEAFQRRQRRDTRSLRVLLESVPDPTLLLYADGEIFSCNALAEALLGYTTTELADQTLDCIFPGTTDADRVRIGCMDAVSGRADEILESLRVDARYRDGRQFPIDARLRALASPFEHLVCLSLHQSPMRANADRLQHEILEELGLLTGMPFLRALLKNIARVIDVRYAFVAKFSDRPEASARVLTFWGGKDFAEPFDYRLPDTLLETVAAGCDLLVTDQLRLRYPDDERLKTLGAESFLGYPLRAAPEVSDAPIGVLAILDTRPIENGSLLRQVLRVCSARAGAELHRLGAIAALQASEARLRDFAELSSDWFWEQDAQFRFIDIGPDAAGKDELRIPDYVGKARWELPSQGVSPQQWAAHRQTLEAHEAFRDFEYNRPSCDGKARWVSISGRPIFDREGGFLGYRGIGRDITRRKSSEQELQRFRLAMDVSIDSIYLTDPHRMLFLDVNLAASKRLGYSREQLLTMGPADVLATSRDELAHTYRTVIESGDRGMSTESVYLKSDGSRGWSELHRHALRLPDRWLIVTIAHDITDRKRAEFALRDQTDQLRTAQMMANMISLTWNIRTGEVSWSQPPEWLIGPPLEDGRYPFIRDLVHPADLPAFLDERNAVLEGKREHRAEYRIVRTDGEVRWVAARGKLSEGTDGAADRLLIVLQDITARKRSDEALRLRDRAIEASVNTVMIMEPNGEDQRIVYVNPAFERITGYPPAEVLGRSPRLLLGKEQNQKGVQTLVHALRAQRKSTVLMRNYRKDGSPFWGEFTVSPVLDDKGRLSHWLGIGNDVTERIQHQDEMERNAYYDSLTGLPNRVLLNDRLGQYILEARRARLTLAVMFVDLDHLKRINDSLGHAKGDQVIAAVGRRLADALRTTDTVARLGGDEFVVVLRELAHEGNAAMVARKLLNSIAAPLRIELHEFALTASVGVAVYPKDGTDGETLLRNADAALFQAKDDGRNCFRFFAPEMNTRTEHLLATERELRDALLESRFLLQYQPIVDLNDGETVGAEALVRLRRRDGTIVAPDEFIPVAEETGQIVAIGAWVLRTAARQVASWNRRRAKPVYVSVNLSARQLRDPDLPQSVQAALEYAGAPSLIRLEITESSVIQDPERAAAFLGNLKKLGVKLLMDDFGTGYSSLGYLKRLPLDVLKIDRSFIRGLPGNRGDRALSRAIIEMAQALALEVVAEGIETLEQARSLAHDGCRYGQGYFFGHPMDPKKFASSTRTSFLGRLRKRSVASTGHEVA